METLHLFAIRDPSSGLYVDCLYEDIHNTDNWHWVSNLVGARLFFVESLPTNFLRGSKVSKTALFLVKTAQETVSIWRDQALYPDAFTTILVELVRVLPGVGGVEMV